MPDARYKSVPYLQLFTQLEFSYKRNTGYRVIVNASKLSLTMSESGKGGEAVWPNDKENLIKEMKKIGLYEDEMDEREMAQLLSAIHESQKSAKGGGGNKNVNKTPETMRQDNQPGHSRVLNSKASERGSTSLELITNPLKKGLSQDKRSDSGDEYIYSPQSRNSYVKENKDIQPVNINKSRLSTNDYFTEAIDNKQSIQRTKSLMRNHETPKFKVHLLEVDITMKDVPLQPIYDTLPKKDCVDIGNRVNIDDALPRLMKHLQHTAVLWQSQQGSSVRSKIPWGKAIQVDTDSGSEDKESVSDTTWPLAGPSRTNVNVDNDRSRRTCARKIIDYTAGEVSESNSDNDFEEASNSEIRKSRKRAASSEKTNLLKDNCCSTETTRRRRIPAKRDDIYVWNEANEEENSDKEEEEEINNAKRKKLTEQASSSENTKMTKENVTSESTGGEKSILNKNEKSEWEAIIDDDDDSAEESEKPAKRKKPTKSRAPTKKITTTRTTRQRSVEPSTSHENENEDDKAVCIDDSDEITIFDNDASRENLQKVQRSRSEETVSSTSSTSYPRRIIPPNPRGKYAGIRARKPLLNIFERPRGDKKSEQNEEEYEEVTRANRKDRSRSSLLESEITEVLENDDEKEVLPLSYDFEIRPLRVSGRMKVQQERLKNIRKREEELELQRAEELRIKEENIQREKAEKIRRRLKEENEKIRLRKQIAKAKIESEKQWNSLLNQQGKKRQVERIELNPEGPRRDSDAPTVMVQGNQFETEDERDLEVVDNDRRSGEESSKRVPCPICGKKFNSKLIEDHAASCEEFDAATTPDASRSNSPVISTRSTTSMRRGNADKLYECVVCSAYASYDGRKFEDHVNKCVTKHRDGVAVGPSALIEVPDSPIRNLRKVSDQTDSEINYRGQFAPKTKSQLNENRKRKRL